MLATVLDSKLLVVEVIAGPHRGTEWRFTKPNISIGRGSHNDVVLKGDTSVSRSHATLIYAGMEWEIQDDGSSNGTYIGIAGQLFRVKQPLPLRGVTRIQVGESVLSIETPW